MKIKKLGFLLLSMVLIGVLVFPLVAFAEYQGSKWKPAPEDLWKWQQFKGETIYVATENTPPSVGMLGVIKDFEELTGMKVVTTIDTMDALKEKIFLDLKGDTGRFHLNYGQPGPIGCMVAEYWVPINKFIDIRTGKSLMPDLPDVPDIPEGTTLEEAYSPMHVEGGCKFFDPTIWYGLPYDTAMGIIFYRKDLFEKYNDKFTEIYGKPLEWTDDTTWYDLYDIGKFFNEYVDEVEYGLGFHSAQNWPVNQSYTAMLNAWGVKKGGFAEIENPLLGSRSPGPYLSDPEDYKKAIDCVEFMKKIEEISHPDDVVFGWNELATAQAMGKIAIQWNCGEFAPYMEDPERSKVAGKIGYGVSPKGPGGINGYEIGCSSMAINGSLPLREQKKAFLYLLWTTGPVAQYKAFEAYSGTPVRRSVYDEARKRGWNWTVNDHRVVGVYLEVQERQMLKYPEGWTSLKIPTYTKYLEIIGSDLTKYITGKTRTAKECVDNMIKRMDKLHKIK